jgi:hypothetical protein
LTVLYNSILFKSLPAIEVELNAKKAKWSILVFKYNTTPTFIDEEVAEWIEVRFAYFLIVEYDDYIVLSKKIYPTYRN